MLYRATTKLDAGKTVINEGDVFPANVLGERAQDILQKIGAIAPCAAPPLEVLPGWKTRAAKLSPAGILTVDDLVTASDAEISALFENCPPDRAQAWKREALDWLKSPRPTG